MSFPILLSIQLLYLEIKNIFYARSNLVFGVKKCAAPIWKISKEAAESLKEEESVEKVRK